MAGQFAAATLSWAWREGLAAAAPPPHRSPLRILQGQLVWVKLEIPGPPPPLLTLCPGTNYFFNNPPPRSDATRKELATPENTSLQRHKLTRTVLLAVHIVNKKGNKYGGVTEVL